MSLLMDALKKAEEAKLGRTDDKAEPSLPAEGLSLEPVRPAAADSPRTPTVAESPPKAEPPRAPSPPTTPPNQAAARNVFAVKQAPAKKNFALLAGGLVVVGGLIIAAWVWWQLKPKAALPMPLATVQPPPPIVPEPVAPSTIATQPPQPLPEPEAPAFATTRQSAATPTAPQEPRKGLKPDDASGAEKPIKLTARKASAPPLAMDAYDALQAGNIVLAQQLYQKLLTADPYNADALYGLAAISLKRGLNAEAEQYYQRALEADPRDSIALAGLAGLRDKPLGEQTESRLKQLLAEQPSAALFMALGNLYARGQRWPDAQQSYFQAYQADSSNPDNAYNLAISLDQMRQPKLAAQFYQEAIKLAEQRPATFRVEDARSRLRELGQ